MTVISKVRSEPSVRQRAVMCGHMLTAKKKITTTTEARRINNDAIDLIAFRDRSWSLEHESSFSIAEVKYLWTNQEVGMYARAIRR